MANEEYKQVFITESKEHIDTLNNGLIILEKGKITFSDEDDSIVMRPEGLLDLKVTATQEPRKNRISIRIAWQTDDADRKKKKMLSVSSK